MNILKAELVLLHDKEYKMIFSLELQEQDYKVNKKFNEWTYFESWISYKIPMNMTIERYYDNYKIIQGFDHKLSEEESKLLEKDMRTLMEKQLNYDKEQFLKEYEKKLEVIRGVDESDNLND